MPSSPRPLSGTPAVRLFAALSPDEDAALRETLKRCRPATYEAARDFRATGDARHLASFVHGILERFVDRELRPKLQGGDASLRLVEDLGLDSLTLMEMVMLAEEVLQITINNEDLREIRTLGALQQRIVELVERGPDAVAARDPGCSTQTCGRAPLTPARPVTFSNPS